MNPEPRFRCSEALLVLVGDTGIEPVTSSVSGINTVLSTPPLSTKTVRRRPLTSPHIRGRCHATSQSPRHPHISGRPRTVHAFPDGEVRPRTGYRILMIVHRLSNLDSVDGAGSEARSPPSCSYLWLSASLVGADLLQLDQLALEVGLQMGAMATLEGSQFFDLFLQHATFTTELLKKL
jgi:hypothetical protein